MGGEGAPSCAWTQKNIPRERDGGGVSTPKRRAPRGHLQLLAPLSAPPRPPECRLDTRRPLCSQPPQPFRRAAWAARSSCGRRCAMPARTGSWATGSQQPRVSRSESTTLCGWGVRGSWCLWSRRGETYESVQTLPLSTLTPTIIRLRP